MSGWLSLEFGMPIRMERFLQTDNRLRSGHTLTIDMKGHCEPEQGPPSFKEVEFNKNLWDLHICWYIMVTLWSTLFYWTLKKCLFAWYPKTKCFTMKQIRGIHIFHLQLHLWHALVSAVFMHLSNLVSYKNIVSLKLWRLFREFSLSQ